VARLMVVLRAERGRGILEVATAKERRPRDGRTRSALHSQQCAAAKRMHALTCPNAELLHLPSDIYASVEGLSDSNGKTRPPTHKHATHTLSYWLVVIKRLIGNTIIRACGIMRASTAHQQQVRCLAAPWQDHTARASAICVPALLCMCPN
jgi:hypothetical protein